LVLTNYCKLLQELVKDENPGKRRVDFSARNDNNKPRLIVFFLAVWEVYTNRTGGSMLSKRRTDVTTVRLKDFIKKLNKGAKR
jgi:hypothetical protein